MAKSAKRKVGVKKETPVVQKDNGVMVIDMDKLLIPFSILIAGLMVSLAVIFSFRGGATINTGNTGTGGTNNGAVGDPSDPPTTGTASVEIGDAPYLGDKKKAKVAIVEFSDYECPFCQRHFKETHSQLIKEYVDTGKAILVFKDFPLSFHEPRASQEALAARCVFEQKGNKGYFEYHDLIFENSLSNGQGFSTNDSEQLAKMEEYAKQVGADTKKWRDCYDSDKYGDAIKADIAQGSAAGVTGTPGFVIGKIDSNGNVTDGTLLAGAYPFNDFKTVLDKLLD